MNRTARRLLERAAKRVARGRHIAHDDAAAIGRAAAPLAALDRRRYRARHPSPPPGWVLDVGADLYHRPADPDLAVKATFEAWSPDDPACRAAAEAMGVDPATLDLPPRYHLSLSRTAPGPTEADVRAAVGAFAPDCTRAEVRAALGTPPPGSRRVVVHVFAPVDETMPREAAE